MAQYNNNGVFSGMPGGTGVAQQPPPTQQMPRQQQQGGYSVDHLPPPPGQGQQAPNPYGLQPGVPGAQIAQPFDPRQQGQQWGAQAPQQQPGWPQVPQAPQQQWGQQQPVPPQTLPYVPQAQTQPQQQGGQQGGMSDSTILDGPAVPPELRGRTWGEARRMYSSLQNEWLQRNRAPTTPAQQTLQQQPQAQQPQGQQTPQGRQPQGRQSSQFWANPDERIAEVVGQVVDQRLGPVLQHTQSQGIMQARQNAASTIQDFSYLEPDIMEIVAGADPAALQNPDVWVAAARMARGSRMERGQYNTQQAQGAQRQPQIPGQQSAYGNGGPGTSVPAQQGPPVHQFFSEAPSAPNIPQSYGAFGQAQQPSQDDAFYAQKFQMPVDQYMQWKHGSGQTPGVF